jgi:hypothetical protein
MFYHINYQLVSVAFATIRVDLQEYWVYCCMQLIYTLLDA